MSATTADVPAPVLHPLDRGGPRQPLLSVRGLTRHFRIRGGLLGRVRSTVHAVDDVTFDVAKGEVLGLVGESGCGKSTTARLLMHLIRPDRGEIVLDGEGVGSPAMPVAAMRRQVQMVFQDSSASLNPRLAVLDSIALAPRMHGEGAARRPRHAPAACSTASASHRRPVRRPLPARAVRADSASASTSPARWRWSLAC